MKIVITGASKGIGKAVAKGFASGGDVHEFFFCARNPVQLQATTDELSDTFPNSSFRSLTCDLSDRKEILRFASWINEHAGGIDILVNNTGTFIPGSVHDEEEGVLEKMISVNLYSAYHLTRALLPGMMKQRSGHIFNICSIASLQAYANGGAYSISKFALAGFSKNLREEMKPHDIKVTTVYPGAAYTDSWKGSGVDPQRLMDEMDIAGMIVASAALSPRACVEEILLRPQLGDL